MLCGSWGVGGLNTELPGTLYIMQVNQIWNRSRQREIKDDCYCIDQTAIVNGSDKEYKKWERFINR